MTTPRWLAPCLAAALVACSGGDKPAPVPERGAGATPPPPADSLALVAPGGVEVWFTAGRDAADSTGAPCTERVMEIRREGRHIPIPLLYTGSAPRLVNDSTIEVPIWLHCRPGNVYRVSLTTGQPTRVQ
jgi:hypothetical protein